ncbi:MAG TPA: hypothetical protein VNM90_09280 [Haliangium sp.]|nr:hypothetical protein [Haliangium sp.]
MVASLAGACVVEEPVGELAGVSWSEAEIESQVEPNVEPAARRSGCRHHYSCCMDTKLGDIKDGPNMTRCYFCESRCEDEGPWPQQTYYGADCQYWKKKYEKKKPRKECL